MEKIRVRTAVTEHLPNSYSSEKTPLWLKANSDVLLWTGSNTSVLSLLVRQVQGDRKRASRANSYIAEFFGSRALKPKVSWHSDCIPFPVCAQNNLGLFGAKWDKRMNVSTKNRGSVQLFSSSFEKVLGFFQSTLC